MQKEFWAIYRLSFANRRDRISLLLLMIVTYHSRRCFRPGKNKRSKTYPVNVVKKQIILPAKNILKSINIVTSRFSCVSIIRLINIVYMKRYQRKYCLTIMRY